MVSCEVFNVNVFVEACCMWVGLLWPFVVYRSYYRWFTPTLSMHFASSSSHTVCQQGTATSRSAQKYPHMEAAPVISVFIVCQGQMSICISDVNRETEGWMFHLFCSNLHRQLSMVPMTGSHQCGGWLPPAPLFYFGPEAHGKAILRPFPVSLRKQHQWFVNRCTVSGAAL